jgi:lysophospholipid acyltransferase (LPLAT)-like uncharacterized protein
MSGARYPWWMGIAAWLGALAFRLLARTWRVDWSGVAALERSIARGDGCIYALWHACLPALTVTHRDRGVATLISRHRDGELVARIVERLGYRAARGSSTRGGEGGLKGMIDFAKEGRLLAVTPDGPRGPAEVLKPGVVAIASASGQPVWAIAAAASSTWILASWDRMRIPRPFARVILAAAGPFAVPRELEGADAERWRVRIEDALREVTARVRSRADEPLPPAIARRPRRRANAGPAAGAEEQA